MTRLTLLLALAAAVLATPVHAQTEVRITGRDPVMLPQPGRQMKTGTGRIKGRLVSAETGSPVRRAQLRITGQDVMARMAITDNDGQFEFRDLPAGRFTITATKSGYVTVGYGQTRPFQPPKPIELAEGQVVDKVDMAMPRGSVISGRIVDEFGEPVGEAMVTALRSTWSNGRRRLQPAGRSATTNDLGQYRIYGLPPGEYFVSATLRGTNEMMVVEMAVAASFSPAPGPDSEPPRSGYAPTYFPGTPSGGEAQKITLSMAQEAQNTDFALVPVRLARITGSVIGSDGRPLEGVMVSATPRTDSQSPMMFPSGGSGRTDKNGNFTLNSVAPGDYTLNARSMQMMTSGSGDGGRMVFTMTRTVVDGSGGDGGSEFGSVPLSVGGEDVANVIIATSKGTTASGRVVYEGGGAPKVNTLRITASSAESDGPMAMLGGSASVTAEGTFEIKGLAGPRIFRVMNVPAGWVLKSIRVNDTDITDSVVEVKPNAPLTGIEVVLTSKTTEVSGTVKAGNDPATDYTVVIFSEDPQTWIVPMSRHIASARPNQDGRFQVKNLPAGSYYAIALDYIAQGDWNDPDLLDRLKTQATRFSLSEGDMKTLDLKLVNQ
jgi:protocatechuate 3,4-dioxygenase beta subunit